MKRFTLTIDLGNEAMQTREDIAAALRTAADRLDDADYEPTIGAVWDANGNRVGRWEITS